MNHNQALGCPTRFPGCPTRSLGCPTRAGFARVGFVATLLLLSLSSFAADAPRIDLDISQVEPRQLEDTTVKAIVRDYGAAWSIMTQALAENRADLLPVAFIGYAHDKLAAKIEQQQKSGLRTRYLDRGHKLQALFYSPEGSSMQLRDTAQFAIQLLDGDKVISEQNVTLQYLSVMTVAEDRWKVRILQAIPTDAK